MSRRLLESNDSDADSNHEFERQPDAQEPVAVHPKACRLDRLLAADGAAIHKVRKTPVAPFISHAQRSNQNPLVPSVAFLVVNFSAD
jgi:hypothetical protein